MRLPTGYYFGMSATTGDLSDNHDLVSIKTYELDTPASVSREERADIMPEVIMAFSSSWVTFFKSCIAYILLCSREYLYQAHC